MRLADVSPFGPIFDKELRTTSRRKRSYFLRVFYLAGLLLFLMLAHAETRQMSMYTGGGGMAARIQQQEQLGATFFTSFAGFCVAAMGLIGPVLTCTAVSSERLHKTLHVLLMTPINSWQIVSGKLFSRLLTAMTLIGLSLPVLALVRLLGGVELMQIFGVICLCTVTAIVAASLGILCSTVINRAYGAILLSYAALLLMYLFTPMMVGLWLSAAHVPDMKWLPLFGASNPFFMTGMVATGEARQQQLEWWPCVVTQLAIAFSFLGLSALSLRRITRREGAGPAPQAHESAENVETSDEASPQSPSIASRRPRTVSNNPILWHELRRPLMAKRWHRMVAAVACVGLLIFVYITLAKARVLGERDAQIGFSFVMNTLGLVLACVLSGTAIAQEKEADTWTVLLASPVSAREIVMGKVLGVLRRMLWPLLLIVAHFFVFAACGVISWPAAIIIIWVMITFNLPWIATGVYLSLRAKKVTTAVIVNLLLPVLAYAAAPAVLSLIDSLDDHYDRLANSVIWYLPYYYFEESVSRLTPFDSMKQIPRPTQGTMHANTFLLIIAGMGVGYFVISGGIVAWTIARFDRFVGRAHQRERLPEVDSRLPTLIS